MRLRRRVRHTFRLGGVGFSWGFLGGGGAEWRLTPPETVPSDKKEGNMSCDAFNRLKNRLENAFGMTKAKYYARHMTMPCGWFMARKRGANENRAQTIGVGAKEAIHRVQPRCVLR